MYQSFPYEDRAFSHSSFNFSLTRGQKVLYTGMRDTQDMDREVTLYSDVIVFEKYDFQTIFPVV